MSAQHLILAVIALHSTEQRTKHQHPQKISTTPAEAALLQRLAVFHQEEHVEHKVQACAGKAALIIQAAVELRSQSSTPLLKQRCAMDTAAQCSPGNASGQPNHWERRRCTRRKLLRVA